MSLLRTAVGDNRIDDTMGKAEAYLDRENREVACDRHFEPLGAGMAV